MNNTSVVLNDLYASIQGEGALTGTPMIVLRLQGCDVGCPFCDTKETWRQLPKNEVFLLPQILTTDVFQAAGTPKFINISIKNLVAVLTSKFPALQWVLITGGEPLLQNLNFLTTALINARFKVALETSGTEPLSGQFDWITVSPKENMPGKKVILPDVILQANELKFVVGRQKHLDQMNSFLKKYAIKKGANVCLQPMSQNLKATKLCLQHALQTGHHLSIQLHKYLEIA